MPLELPELKEDTSTSANRLWQIVLLDDDTHTYDYVIEMLVEIFHHPIDLAYRVRAERHTAASFSEPPPLGAPPPSDTLSETGKSAQLLNKYRKRHKSTSRIP